MKVIKIEPSALRKYLYLMASDINAASLETALSRLSSSSPIISLLHLFQPDNWAINRTSRLFLRSASSTLSTTRDQNPKRLRRGYPQTLPHRLAGCLRTGRTTFDEVHGLIVLSDFEFVN
jgi:hypothetical protein